MGMKPGAWDYFRGLLIDNNVSDEDLNRFDVLVARRRFLQLLGKGSAAVALLGFGAGTDAVVSGLFGRGLIPIAWAAETEIISKPGMIIHSEKPVVGEFSPHLLDDDITPSSRHFVRNHGLIPERAQKRDLQGWTLTIDGAVHTPLQLSMEDLKNMPSVSIPACIESSGNGRIFFEPAVSGVSWKQGAVGCSEWTGVPLREILNRAGLKEGAVYTGHYGEDRPLSGAPPFSRGIPIDKAMERNTLVAYKMNGKDLPALNGYPARLVVPGWIGSCSQKWLSRIWIRTQVHDSEYMSGYSYRVPSYPVIPGSKPAEKDMIIATSLPINSMITSPPANSHFKVGEVINVRGHAWTGEGKIRKLLITTDYGLTWNIAKLESPVNKFAWCRWEIDIKFDHKGYYEIWSKAYDDDGHNQPFRQPWNPGGYLGNAVHRLPVIIGL